MKKTIVIRTFIILFVVSLFVLLVIKVDTNIYVGDYSYSPCRTDIQLKIDNELILDDTLVSSPFFPTIITKKLKYGFHEISVSSKIAGVNQKNRIFLLPNQYIYIELLGADSLYLKGDSIVNEYFPS
ncbi:hypothetical protein, partial [Bacteroides sp.]